MVLQTIKQGAIAPQSLERSKAMVQDLVLADSLKHERLDNCSIGVYLYSAHGVAVAVRVAAGNSPGVEAGILAALMSAGSFVLGLLISSSVTPASTFVSPITGGSPFLTNSYRPVHR